MITLLVILAIMAMIGLTVLAVVIGGVFAVVVANRTQRSGYIVIAVFAIRPLQARLLAGRRCLGMEFAHAVACGRKCLYAHYYRLQRS